MQQRTNHRLLAILSRSQRTSHGHHRKVASSTRRAAVCQRHQCQPNYEEALLWIQMESRFAMGTTLDHATTSSVNVADMCAAVQVVSPLHTISSTMTKQIDKASTMACQVNQRVVQAKSKSRLLVPLLRRQHRGFFLQWISSRTNLRPTLQSKDLQLLLQVSECQLTAVLGVSPRLHVRVKTLVQQLKARRHRLSSWTFFAERQEFVLSSVHKAKVEGP